MDYDFDINNYSIGDIEQLFQLKKGQYTSNDIVIRKTEFHDKIMTGSGEFNNKTFITTLNHFLEEACDLLTYVIRDKIELYKQKEHYDNSRHNDGHPPDDFYNVKYDLQDKKRNSDAGRGRLDEIIEKHPSDFSSVMQNEFNIGKMNPLHTPILTRCLNIDTRFRENLYTSQSSNFTLTLPTKIKKVVSMQLSAYEFPVAFYGTSESYGNNYLNIFCTYKYVSMAQSYTSMKTIILFDGNYSAVDLIEKINSQLRPVGTDGSLLNTALDSSYSIFNCVQFSLDVNTNFSGSGKIILQTSDADSFAYASVITSIALDFTLNSSGITDTMSIISKIGWNLGFIRPKYSGATVYVADTLPEPASMRYIYLVVNDFNNSVNNHFVGAFNNWILNDNILARITINGQYFNILMENDLSQHIEPRKYFGPVDIQRLQIKLLDDHGRILDINNANYSICLTFKCLYD
jgi:hypothetical protein